MLRNEFCEIDFDPHTGAIRSISDYHSRDPRLAQQIALRLPHGGRPEAEANYSIMAADEIAVTSAGPVLGEIVCRGRLLDREGRRVAGFRQTTRLWRGSRVIELLRSSWTSTASPATNPWDSYYAVRFAWKDETAELVPQRQPGQRADGADADRIAAFSRHSPRQAADDAALRRAALPSPLRARKLDTLLVVHGETARTFRLGIGIDVPHPMAAALGLARAAAGLARSAPAADSDGLALSSRLPQRAGDPLGTAVVGTRRVRTDSHSRRRQPDTACASTAGGFRVRLLETDGRGVQLGLRCFRAVASARKINPGDVPPVELAVEGDRVDVPIGPHQWIEVEVLFS